MASASMKRLWREMSDAARARPDPYRLRGLPLWRRWAETVLCIARAIVRDLLGGELTLRAMSLVYTTLLSLVPLLAIGFSVLKALGAHNRVEPVLAELLEPLGPQGREITTRIVDFVDNIEVGVLGFVGLLLLFYTVISLLQKIEHALNFIWHVPGQRRPLEKVRDYLSAVIIGPVLLIAATGAIASLMSSQLVQSMAEFGPIGQAIALAGRMTSIALIIAAFTFLYMFLPNTRVRFGPALAGGITAGALWMLTGWAFATFIAGSVRYAAIYSAFASLIFFLIWLYLVWLIVLLGCSVAFYAQNPQYIGIDRSRLRYPVSLVERAGLLAIYHILDRWYRGEPAPSGTDIGEKTGIPTPLILQVIAALEHAGLVKCTEGSEGGFVPARPPETTPLKTVLDAVRSDEGAGHPPIGHIEEPPAVSQVVGRIDAAIATESGEPTLRDFVQGTAAEAERRVAT